MANLYSPAQLSTMMDALTARVNAIDGQNLSPKFRSELQKLRAGIDGLKKTLGQVNLGYQGQNAKLTQQLNAVSSLVNTLSGIPPSQ